MLSVPEAVGVSWKLSAAVNMTDGRLLRVTTTFFPDDAISRYLLWFERKVLELMTIMAV